MFSYIKYFFYLAGNWNLRIAAHIINKEIKGEKKYGIDTTGADELHSLQDKGIDITNATIYMPASYDMLEIIFNHLKDQNIKHLIDIGCGKGRVLCVAPWYSITKVSGVDFSFAFCQKAIENLEKTKSSIPSLMFTVKNNDAFYYEIPDDADCIFLFNPFNETIMSGVIENILMSIERKHRSVFIIYFNPLNKDLFINAGFEQIFQVKKLSYLEACILKNK